jgi:hypothetical protein
MFKRTLLILFAVLVALLAMVPAFAQEGGWTVSLYDQASGTVTRLSATGETVDQFTLPLPEGFDSYSYAIATSPLGDKIAYVVEQVGDGSVTTPPSRLVVYDPNADTIVASADLKQGINQEGFNAASDSLTFNADGSQVLSAYDVPVSPEANTYSLETIVLDVASGQVANMLSVDALAAAGVQTDAAYRTTVLGFPGETAALVLQPVFVDMDLQPVAVNWNLGTGEAAPIAPDLVNAVDYLPATGEALILIISADPNATLDPNAPLTMEHMYNAVELFSSGDAQIIYRADTVYDAQFVQNGERILVFTRFDEATLINRDGTELQTFTIPGGAGSVASTPDGFAYYDPQSASGLTVVTTADDSFTVTPISTDGITFSSISVQDYQMNAATEETAG